MASRDKERYYWLKMEQDFFRRHEMLYMDSLEHGKEYELLFIKLMLESVSRNGKLQLSRDCPCDTKLLSVMTNTEPSIVEEALELYKKLGLIRTTKSGVIAVPMVEDLLDYETYKAKRMREYREHLCSSGSSEPVCSPDIDIDKYKTKR